MSAGKVMVVEDSLPNQNIMVLTFRKMGFEVECFSNGLDAWKRLEGEPEGWAFIFCDYMMPEMDGLQLLRNVRGLEKTKDLPFFLVTAMSDKDVVMNAKNLKVSGYVVKPIAYAKILAKVQPLYPERKFPKAA